MHYTLAYRPLSIDLTTVLFSSPAPFNSANSTYLYPHTHKQASRRRRPFFFILNGFCSDYTNTTPFYDFALLLLRINITPTYHHHHPQRLSYVPSSPARLRAAAVAGLVSLPPPAFIPSIGKGEGAERTGFHTVKPLGGKYEKEGKKGKAVVFMTYTTEINSFSFYVFFFFFFCGRPFMAEFLLGCCKGAHMSVSFADDFFLLGIAVLFSGKGI